LIPLSCTVVIAFLPLFLNPSAGYAQSLGEIVRGQRAAKQRVSPRIYTNEDLARPQILDPSEREHLQHPASTVPAPAPEKIERPQSPVFVTAPATPQFVQPLSVPMSLGDVARFYRLQKQLRPQPAPQEVLATGGGTPQISSLPTLSVPPFEEAAPESPLERESLPSDRQVRVLAGDSLWKIARRYLGDGMQWNRIAAANPELADPSRLRIGQTLRLPGETSAMLAATQIRVQPGDSLWKLAKAQWGAGQAWGCILESNPQIQGPDRIYPGQTLTLPDVCSAKA
jgi:nucleoid-associated protein YgaU